MITAGGLKESASLVRVDVSRRIRDPKGTTEPDMIGQNFSFGLKDGFVVDGEAGFELQPYDQVFVRRSPSYNEQVNVTVDGEVLYRGDYTLNTKSERLSGLIQRAGGREPLCVCAWGEVAPCGQRGGAAPHGGCGEDGTPGNR